ncbi:MAG: serpin family protein [Persicimonas sp.]
MYRQFMFIVAVCCIFIFVGCDREGDAADDEPEAAAEGAEETRAEAQREDGGGADDAESGAARADEREGEEPDEDDVAEWDDSELPEERGAVESNNIFAHEFFEYAGDKNVAFSPFSIASAMAMVYAGADGETAAQLADTLEYGRGAVEDFGELTSTLDDKGEEDRLELDVVNDLWVDSGVQFGSAYLETLDRYFGADVTELRFSSSPDRARKRINDDVAENTRGKIEELLSPPMVTRDTLSVLTNAIYFKGEWASPFDEQKTHQARFEAPDEAVTVPMMEQRQKLRIARGKGYEALEKEYVGGELAALVILPNRGAFDEVEEELDADLFSEAVDGLSYRGLVDLKMPKFEVRQRFKLKRTLQEMGAERPFSPSADFHRIYRPFFLDKVVHEAVIEVDEKATEAAAATAVTVTKGGPPKTYDFVVNRPFFFYIFDKPTGTILFASRVLDPTE